MKNQNPEISLAISAGKSSTLERALPVIALSGSVVVLGGGAA